MFPKLSYTNKLSFLASNKDGDSTPSDSRPKQIWGYASS